jgi:uncharacterized protein
MNKLDYKNFVTAYRITTGKSASKNDHEKAFEIWQELAEKYIRSAFYLGVCYDNGFGTKKDLMKAFEWYKTAADEGHKEAMYNLYLMYRDGKGVKKNNKLALKHLNAAAEKKDAAALGDLGFCYHEGKLLSKNFPKAANLYRQAALMGDVKSQWNLALCYFDGDGLKRSNRWGKYWLQIAANNGHLNAIRKLKELAHK